MNDLNAVTCESGVNPKGGGWVRLMTHDVKTVMSPEEARDLGMNLLRCAEAAETDNVLVKIGRELAGDEGAGMLLLAIREARAGNLRKPDAKS
jgi:hypothetical protein